MMINSIRTLLAFPFLVVTVLSSVAAFYISGEENEEKMEAMGTALLSLFGIEVVEENNDDEGV